MSVFKVINNLSDFVIVAQIRANDFPRDYDPYKSTPSETYFFRLCDAERFRNHCVVHRGLSREDVIVVSNVRQQKRQIGNIEANFLEDEINQLNNELEDDSFYY